ncbi:MAG: hypothetical protein H6815_05220 [Phycisphaeraceae bacterium]|nr:hypothetical protein [Phycisphaerales bacterium]MCB9859837.1 hypothetical protein [Phycisphaeraceae bacterium]
MRWLILTIVFVFSLALVFAESAYFAAHSPMDFQPTETRPWPRHLDAEWPKEPEHTRQSNSAGMSAIWYSILTGDLTKQLYPDLYQIVVVRTGWPIRTFAFERTFVLPEARGTIGWQMDNVTSIWTGGIEIPSWLRQPDERPWLEPSVRRVPIRPIWHTSFLMTLVHMSILCSPWIAWRRFVRHRRRSKGCCIHCGYNIADLTTCPECGHFN